MLQGLKKLAAFFKAVINQNPDEIMFPEIRDSNIQGYIGYEIPVNLIPHYLETLLKDGVKCIIMVFRKEGVTEKIVVFVEAKGKKYPYLEQFQYVNMGDLASAYDRVYNLRSPFTDIFTNI